MKAPAWNYVTEAFEGNTDISFGDVNLSEESNLAKPNKAGFQGWPSIRYFNKDTGLEGADYVRKTNKKLCEELGDEDNMIAYVESAGMTTMCSLDYEGCDDTERSFLDMMKDGGKELQLRALEKIKDEEALNKITGMLDESMQVDLKRWLAQRRKLIMILLEAKEDAAEVGEEL